MQTQTVDLGFKPRPWQLKALQSLKRFSVLVVHRRGGKTLAAIMKTIDAALRLQRPNGRFAFIAPELKQAKDNAWHYVRDYASKVPRTRIHESELWVEFAHNGARIRLYGADDPDNLRGGYLDGVVLDEVAQLKSYVWGEVLLPQLADRQGWAIFIGTPKGTNLLSERYYKALQDPTWYAECFTIDDTHAIPEAELEVMRAQQTEQQWRQEMLCDFNASSDEALIGIDLVRAALGRHLRSDAYDFAGKVLGVDVALGGGDKTVLQLRQGLAAFKPDVLDLRDPKQIGDFVAVKIDQCRVDTTFVDASGGWGSGVISRLTELGYSPIGVDFGGKPTDSRFANKSAEMWWQMKLWLESGGALPDDNSYIVDMTGRLYDYKNAAGKLALEKKEAMKARGLKSPDLADALALTFAAPVAAKRIELPGFEYQLQYTRNVHEYDPFERAQRERERVYG